MDAGADDWEPRAQDHCFSSLDRLEDDLSSTGDVAASMPAAASLLAAAPAVAERIEDLAVPPAVMVGGANALIAEVARASRLATGTATPASTCPTSPPV